MNTFSAGKYGYVQAAPDGTLTFEKAPGKRLRLYGALWLLAAMAIGAASGAMFGTVAADGGSNTAPSVFGLISAVCVAFIALVRLLPTSGKLGAKLAAWEAAGRGVRSALAALALSLPPAGIPYILVLAL